MNNPALSQGKPILVVDDSQHAIDVAVSCLVGSGEYEAVGCIDSLAVMELLAARPFRAVLLDLCMPGISGEELLPRIVAEHPRIPVVIVTAHNAIDLAVRCMKAGAFDFLVKPVSDEKMLVTVRNALALRDLQGEFLEFRERVFSGALRHPEFFTHILSRDRRMLALFQYVESVAASPRPVLITGETGTGKELMARAVYEASGRTGPFVSVNAAGLDDQMFSDTLFGHVRGAFTGADRARPGLVEQAAGGTLFLDEMGDLSSANQTKLLRLLQEEEYLPLGADLPKRSRTRVLAATNRDLDAMSVAGTFRQDLYFRLRTHHIHLPPLRERMADLPLLTEHFLEKAARTLGKKTPTPPPQLAGLLSTYDYPGNLRELESILFEAVSLHTGGVLSLEPIHACLAKRQGEVRAPALSDERSEYAPFANFPVLPKLKDAEAYLIAEALRRTGGNQSLAAKLLGITQSGMNKAVKRRGLV